MQPFNDLCRLVFQKNVRREKTEHIFLYAVYQQALFQGMFHHGTAGKRKFQTDHQPFPSDLNDTRMLSSQAMEATK